MFCCLTPYPTKQQDRSQNTTYNEVQVDIVQAQQLERLVEAELAAGGVGGPALGDDKEVLALDDARRDGLADALADLLLVAVDVGAVDEPVAALDGRQDGLLDDALVALPGACFSWRLTPWLINISFRFATEVPGLFFLFNAIPCKDKVNIPRPKAGILAPVLSVKSLSAISIIAFWVSFSSLFYVYCKLKIWVGRGLRRQRSQKFKHDTSFCYRQRGRDARDKWSMTKPDPIEGNKQSPSYTCSVTGKGSIVLCFRVKSR